LTHIKFKDYNARTTNMAPIPRANSVPKENTGNVELKEVTELGPDDLGVGEDGDEDDVLGLFIIKAGDGSGLVPLLNV
jgi:hypothetical protein